MCLLYLDCGYCHVVHSQIQNEQNHLLIDMQQQDICIFAREDLVPYKSNCIKVKHKLRVQVMARLTLLANLLDTRSHGRVRLYLHFTYVTIL